MDPVLKAGLPKLFVLEVRQTAATHTETRRREKGWGEGGGGGGGCIEHFMEKVQIRRANCNRKEGQILQS